MRNRKQKIKYILLLCVFSMFLIASCKRSETGKTVESKEVINAQWENAAHTPYGKYPELVTYTLGKIVGSNNANLPVKATYEDNAYTRYLKERLNIQNEDVLEGENSDSYEEAVQILMEDQQLPDLLVVKGRETVKELVRRGMVEDLTTVYEECTTERIKEMYQSYGEALLESATFDGRLYALPDAEVDHGASLLWLRKDWMERLGLSDPVTLEEGMEIIRQFVKADMAGNQETVGLAGSTDLVSENSGTYGLDAVFDQYHAKPSQWILNDQGNVVYGSVTEETKQALIYLHQLYVEGILDSNFLLRQQENLDTLLKEGKCGAIFGYWWAPNNPLSLSYSADRTAKWQPYLLTGNAATRTRTFQSYEDCLYVVVRKGYEHPEIVMKIMTALFDNARYRHDGSEEIDLYQKRGVDTTARPLVANCDFSNAVFTTTDHIWLALHYPRQTDSMNSLESAYYDSCRRFLDGDRDPVYWAAYASRIQAVRLIEEADVSYVNEDYVPYSHRELPQDMTDMETLAFMKIITGEEPISYFDFFTESWKKNMILENLLY